MGDLVAPTVSVSGFPQPKDVLESAVHNEIHLSMSVKLVDGLTFVWHSMFIDRKLFVEVPFGLLPKSSRESFILLLEYAEDALKCSHVIVCFRKDRPDRSALLKVFMFFGFILLPPHHHLIPAASGDIMYLAYARQVDDDDDDENNYNDNDDNK